MLNILFVCSRNQWRSPTAERLWRRQPGIAVRSAGTSRNARRRINASDITWADLILVMEEKHRARIRSEFAAATRNQPIHVLDIPDEYRFMDAELVELLQGKVQPLLDAALGDGTDAP